MDFFDKYSPVKLSPTRITLKSNDCTVKLINIYQQINSIVKTNAKHKNITQNITSTRFYYFSAKNNIVVIFLIIDEVPNDMI